MANKLEKCKRKRTDKWKRRQTKRHQDRINIKLSLMSPSMLTPGEIRRAKFRETITNLILVSQQLLMNRKINGHNR